MQSATRASRGCLRTGSRNVLRPPLSPKVQLRFASSSSRPIRSSAVIVAIGAVSLIAFPVYVALFPKHPALQPQVYTDLTVFSTQRVTPQHASIGIPIPPGSRSLFGIDAVRRDRSKPEDGEIVIQHLYVKNPDLMIERPYTPVNNVERDGIANIVVKKVQGGEVGRHIHGLHAGDSIGIRGPVTTFAINPTKYDKIIMISTGTGISPFLQLLDKLPVTSSTELHILHSLPKPDKQDWVVSSGLLPRLQDRFGDQLTVDRIPPGSIPEVALESALRGADKAKVMVLVCLPPNLLKSVAGPMAPNLGQGPLRGTLADLGLSPANVVKLE
ncbi:hypothetical protein BCR39DRAFT_477596 [Naematelia encephala]|uniref:FAD-binding FR-type domain-containing protein n=1 Tax=Naematelia encephala TaxID=71784 RepID=A0A1Y2BH33_9TREE|nr:hypothetical protein BCR39DRAFT_477596 [Naematelia encephala]